MDVVLGVDVGTTSVKALACDAQGRVRARSDPQRHPLREPAPGHAEQDPERMLDASLAALRQVGDRARGAGHTVRGICVSAAMHSLLGVDAAGAPVTPLMVWADTRASASAERLRAQRPYLHARTGTPLHPMSPLVKLAHLHEHDGGAYAKVARWLGIKELAVHRLTGVWNVDLSIASGTGLLDLRTRDWDPEALHVAGVRPDQLCPLRPVDHIVGGLHAAAAAATALPPGTPVVLGAGDGPLANVGVGATEPGVAACSIGTSGALRLTVDGPVFDEAGRLFCYASTPGHWVVGGAVTNGGLVLQWARDALAPDLAGPDELLALAATAPAGSDGLLMLPHLLGERAPRWDARAVGAYVGLRRSHGRAHLLRAALEGVCQQLALVLDALHDAGHDVREVRATGGFTAGVLWPQILADVLACDLWVPAEQEGSALGAARLGTWALGLAEDPGRATPGLPDGRIVRPVPDASATYAAMRPVFAALSEALQPAAAALRPLSGGTDAAPTRPPDAGDH